MHSRTHIRRVGIQTLPHHQHAFAMRISSLRKNRDVRRNRSIPGRNLLPDEVELVKIRPHVRSTGRDAISAIDLASVRHRANVQLAFKQALGIQRDREQEQQKTHASTDCNCIIANPGARHAP